MDICYKWEENMTNHPTGQARGPTIATTESIPWSANAKPCHTTPRRHVKSCTVKPHVCTLEEWVGPSLLLS